MGNLKRLEIFFNKNYDYYLLIILIITSLFVSSLDYYEVFVDQDGAGFYYNLPCFLKEQNEFIEHASLEINDLLPKLGIRVLPKIIIENFMGIIFILGIYFSGKFFFIKTKKEWLKVTLKILGIVYLIIIINAAIITPIAGCLIQIG